MTDIFQIHDTSIFRKRFALSTKYIPENLIARDQQINDIVNLVRPVLSQGEPKNAMIFGKTGTGKTVVVKYVLKKLNDKMKSEHLNISSVFINCRAVNTTTRIIFEILDVVAPDIKFQRGGLPISEYYNLLWKELNQKQLSIIIVFDEIDHLKDYNILYNLSRAGENHNINIENSIGVIGISNDLFFGEKIEPRIVSSLSCRDFIFPPYDATQLIKILNDRAEIAFQNDVLDDAVIPVCAAYSAQEHGDARKALMILENAGEVAERKNEKKVREYHVKEGYEMLNIDCLLEMVKTLPLQSKVILYSIIKLIQNKDRITTGEVENKYKEVGSVISCRILGRTSISKLIAELEMIGLINANIEYRGRYGKTRLISSCKESKKIMSILLTDPWFSNIKDHMASMNPFNFSPKS